jgi:hypothetical protein
VALDARAEFFNVFNHPMFYFPNNFLNPPYTGGFGLVTTTLNNGLATGGGFNNGYNPGALNPLYQIGGPRSAQFTLKLTF